MTRTREQLAAAVRPFGPDGRLLPEHIPALDALADALGLPAAASADAGRYGPGGYLTAPALIGGFIDAHEGGLSLDPADNGNWTGGKRGRGNLVGSKYGVTPGALADYRGVAASSITAADINAITRDLAVAIGVANYYERPGLDKLPMNRVTLSVVDKGWGSGPAQAVKLLQRMVGAQADGRVGPATIAAYDAWLAKRTEEQAAREWADVRMAFDMSLGQPRFVRGWNNRTKSFLPGTEWWREAKL